VATSFEETYCWQKGEKADPLGSKMVQVTQRDEQEVKTSIPVGGQIGLAWKTHLLCHAHFNTVNAVKESFVLKK